MTINQATGVSNTHESKRNIFVLSSYYSSSEISSNIVIFVLNNYHNVSVLKTMF